MNALIYTDGSVASNSTSWRCYKTYKKNSESIDIGNNIDYNKHINTFNCDNCF